MADVPAGNTASAEPASTASQTPAPAQTQSVTNEPKTVPYDEYERVKGAAFKANRLYEELAQKLEKLQTAQPQAHDIPKPPAGVEERLSKLAEELAAERHARAEEKLQIRIMEAAGKHGVSPERVEFLDFKLRKANAGLSADGVPDPVNPSAKISIDTLVSSLLSTSEGAVFKSAPATASLPGAAKTQVAQSDGLPEFTKEQFEKGLIPVAIRKAGAYRVKD